MLQIKEEKAVTSENLEKLSNEVNQLKDAIEMLRKQEQEQEQEQEQQEQEQEQQGQKENPDHKALDRKESSSDKTNSTRTKLLHRIICIGGNTL